MVLQSNLLINVPLSLDMAPRSRWENSLRGPPWSTASSSPSKVANVTRSIPAAFTKLCRLKYGWAVCQILKRLTTMLRGSPQTFSDAYSFTNVVKFSLFEASASGVAFSSGIFSTSSCCFKLLLIAQHNFRQSQWAYWKINFIIY